MPCVKESPSATRSGPGPIARPRQYLRRGPTDSRTANARAARPANNATSQRDLIPLAFVEIPTPDLLPAQITLPCRAFIGDDARLRECREDGSDIDDAGEAICVFWLVCELDGIDDELPSEQC